MVEEEFGSPTVSLMLHYSVGVGMVEVLLAAILLTLVLAIFLVPIVKTSQGYRPVVPAIIEAQKKAREEEKRLNELRQDVASLVLSSMQNSETLDKFEQRFKAIAASSGDLEQFGQLAFSTALQALKQDRRLTPAREALLSAIVTKFDVPPLMVKEAEADLSRGRVLYGLDQGTFPEITVPGLVLLKGEMAYWSETGAIFEERVVHSEYVGRSGGISVRVMKGVYLRSGGFRGHVESQKGLVPISNGALVLTNHRLIFHGDKKSTDARWNKVLDVEFFTDGVRFSISNRSKPTTIQFNHPENTEIVHKIVSHIINQLQTS